MGNKRIQLVIKVSLSLIIVGVLSLRVKWGVIGRALLDVDLSLYLFSTFLTLITSLFIAIKYRILIRDSDIDHCFLSLARINLISRFYALLLPFGTARDAVRWYKVTRNKNGRAFFMACTIFERATFVLVLLIFGCGPLFFCPFASEISDLGEQILPLILLVLFAICVVIAYFLSPAVRGILRRLLIKIWPFKKMRDRMEALFQGFSLLKGKAFGLMIWLILVSLLWQGFFIFRIYTLFEATEIPLGLLDAAWMGSMVLLLQMLPLSFAGIGIREGAYAYLFGLSGLPPEDGVLIGILFFSQMLILAAFGGILELTDLRARRVRQD